VELKIEHGKTVVIKLVVVTSVSKKNDMHNVIFDLNDR
jgi:pyruvate carboxylase